MNNMLLSNYEIAIRLSKGERIALDKIMDKKGVVMHIEAIERNCVGIVRLLKQEIRSND